MLKSRHLEPEDRHRNERINIEMGDWVDGLAKWQCVAHLTFRWEASVWSCERVYKKFMRAGRPGLPSMHWVSHFYALEHNPSRDGFHVHALWCDCLHLQRSEVWRNWFHRYGRNRIEPVRNKDDVADYVAKYVTKEGAWWDVHLSGQPLLALKK